MISPNKLVICASVLAFFGLSACGSLPQTTARDDASTEKIAAPQTETDRINAFFETSFQRSVKRSPIYQSYLGVKDDYGKWDDLSEARQDEDIRIVKEELDRLHHDFDFAKLDDQAKLSYRLFEQQSKQAIEGDHWRHYNYPVNQMFGWQSQIPSILINIHTVASVADAEAYISRLNGVRHLLAQVVDGLEIRRKAGVIAPKFVYPLASHDIRNILTGAPFDTSGKDSPLFADFKNKVEALEIDPTDKQALVSRARDALLTSVRPGYQALQGELDRLAKVATNKAGVWKLPDSDDYYKFRLKKQTTTDMTADQIHDLGLSEVARIHGEMETIKDKVGFKGNLHDFFAFMRTDKQFYLPDTPAGREAYLDKARGYLKAMKASLDKEFDLKPKADIVVKAVEPFREKSAGVAFYEQPAPDGSRPGRFYVNLYDMAQMPTYQLEALVYHEGIPGHHMQIAIAQELPDIPKFRKYGGYTAYVEGWGLYAEWLGKDMGFYQDPYSDFGRLTMELWRAARLVVDTGIHAKKWTEQQAVAYLDQNTPSGHDENVKAIERYIVMPGQATAYKIGMMKIMGLRAKAHKALGSAFDVHRFHDVILENGAVPLNILEENVDHWIAARRLAGD